MRDKLIAEVLKIIEETEEIKNLNLRQVAKRVGCAHTNVYNYFKSTEEMLWQAVIPAMEQMNSATVADISKMSFNSDLDRIRTLLAKHIEFALAHKGLYRFIWLEKASDSTLAPENLAVMLKQYWLDFLDCLFSRESPLSTKDKNRIGSILFCYLHGQICLLINDRFLSGDFDKMIKNILDNGSMLFSLLVNKCNTAIID